MKRCLSVMKLAAAGSVYRAAGLMMVMGSVELMIFYYLLGAIPGNMSTVSLEEMVASSGMAVIGLTSFVVLCLILMLPECEYGGSRIGYTIRRLSVSERDVWGLWTVYHVLVLILFWMVQLLVALAACSMYLQQADPACISEQTVLLAFYRKGFLHNLMPLEDWSRYVRNLLVLICMGMGISDFSWKQRRGGYRLTLLVPLLCVLFGFTQGTGDGMASDLFICIVNGFMMLIMVMGLWRDGDEEAEN